MLLDADRIEALGIEVRARVVRDRTADDLAPVGSAEVDDQIGARVDEHLDPQVDLFAGSRRDEPVVLDVRPQFFSRKAQLVHGPRMPPISSDAQGTRQGGRQRLSVAKRRTDRGTNAAIIITAMIRTYGTGC